MTNQHPSVNMTNLETGSVPLVEVTRGNLVESRHRGHIAAVEPDGTLVAFAGAPETVSYLRSAAKLHQAIPLLTSGAAERFGFTERELALACASHSGEPIHTELAASMLGKINLTPEALKCGTHEPFSEVIRRLRQKGEEPNVLQNNCSGKHAGMLALALHLGAPTETYDQPENPAQVMIKDCISRFSSVASEEIITSTDGCGVPVFALSISAMALMCARLIVPPADFDSPIVVACRTIVSAVTAHPELIGGTADRLDTELIRAARGRLISKIGAEGVDIVGVLPCKEWPKGLGLALKIEDGDDHRARPTVVIEALRQLKVLKDKSLEAVSSFRSFTVRNHRGDAVGEVKASFVLNA
jgi:L-asparaginase II